LSDHETLNVNVAKSESKLRYRTHIYKNWGIFKQREQSPRTQEQFPFGACLMPTSKEHNRQWITSFGVIKVHNDPALEIMHLSVQRISGHQEAHSAATTIPHSYHFKFSSKSISTLPKNCNAFGTLPRLVQIIRQELPSFGIQIP
jgi:hypothetical protein